ncbi:MAG: DUF2147 domain-containing protein [Bacteroidota bacterium]
MRKSLLLSATVAYLFILSGTHAARAQDSTKAYAIVGEWLTAGGTSKIEIYKDGEEFSGRIVWLKEPDKDGKPKVDENNPEAKLRTRPLLGMTILRGFEFDGDDVWKGGKIYDPKSGNDYSAKMTLVDEHTLDLRGYVLMPLFGRTETWTR